MIGFALLVIDDGTGKPYWRYGGYAEKWKAVKIPAKELENSRVSVFRNLADAEAFCKEESSNGYSNCEVRILYRIPAGDQYNNEDVP